MKNENLHEKAQKKYGGISEEELKKLKTKVEKKRKSYNSPQDIITVFAIFAILALTCVLLSFIDRNPESLIGSSGGSRNTKTARGGKAGKLCCNRYNRGSVYKCYRPVCMEYEEKKKEGGKGV